MQLCAVLTKGDLTSVVEQITPLRVTIRPRRVISLGRPTAVELVAGKGLRLRGAARFSWDALGITIPVTVRSWQILLIPFFASRADGRVLAFDPVLEDLVLRRLPTLVDGGIAEMVKSGLAAQRGKLAWPFEKHLSLVRPLPAKVSPGGELSLGPTDGKITVTSTEVRLTLDFELDIRRDMTPASVRAPSSSDRLTV